MKNLIKFITLLILWVFFVGCNEHQDAGELIESVKVDANISQLHMLLQNTMRDHNLENLTEELTTMGFNAESSELQVTKYTNIERDCSIEFTVSSSNHLKSINYFKRCSNLETAKNHFLQWSKQNRIENAWYNFDGKINNHKYSNYIKFLLSMFEVSLPISNCYEHASDFYLNYTVRLNQDYIVSYAIEYY